MNREQRRAAKFKRAERNRNIINSASTGGLGLIKLTQTYSEDEYRRLSAGTRLAWYKLSNGMGTQDDFDMMATSLNVAAVMARDIDELVLDAVEQGMASLVDMKARHTRTGRFGVDAKALQTVPHALNVYDEILKHSTPLQTSAALRTSMRMIDHGHVLEAPEMSVMKAGAAPA